jgi:hypothetical protein
VLLRHGIEVPAYRQLCLTQILCSDLIDAGGVAKMPLHTVFYPWWAIRFAAEVATEFPDPHHRLVKGRHLPGHFFFLVDQYVEGLPLGRGELGVAAYLWAVPCRVHEPHDPEGCDTVDTDGLLQRSRLLQLQLLYLGPAFQCVMEPLDQPAVDVPLHALEGLRHGPRFNGGQQFPVDDVFFFYPFGRL